jgi:hypothetical protein
MKLGVDMKKGIGRRLIEYIFASLILGIPFYTVISLWAVLNNIMIIVPIAVGLFYSFLAYYQLKRVSILRSKNRINLYLFLGAACIIVCLFSLLSLFQNAAALEAAPKSIGTVDSTINNLNAIIMPSLGFGFLLGLGIIFLGYARLESAASHIST